MPIKAMISIWSAWKKIKKLIDMRVPSDFVRHPGRSTSHYIFDLLTWLSDISCDEIVFISEIICKKDVSFNSMRAVLVRPVVHFSSRKCP